MLTAAISNVSLFIFFIVSTLPRAISLYTQLSFIEKLVVCVE